MHTVSLLLNNLTTAVELAAILQGFESFNGVVMKISVILQFVKIIHSSTH